MAATSLTLQQQQTLPSLSTNPLERRRAEYKEFFRKVEEQFGEALFGFKKNSTTPVLVSNFGHLCHQLVDSHETSRLLASTIGSFYNQCVKSDAATRAFDWVSEGKERILESSIGTYISTRPEEKRIQKQFDDRFILFLSQHPDLKGFLCPIRKRLTIEPVETPDGRVYEKAAIYSQVKTFGCYPDRNEPLFLEQIRSAPDISGRIVQAVSQILQKDLEVLADFDPKYENLVTGFRVRVLRYLDQQYDQQMGKINTSLKSGHLGYLGREVAEQMVANTYYPTGRECPGEECVFDS